MLGNPVAQLMAWSGTRRISLALSWVSNFDMTRPQAFIGVALFSGLGLVSAFAGSISGTVRGLPPAGAPPAADSGGAYESRRYKYVEKIDYASLRDFIVHIDQPLNEV